MFLVREFPVLGRQRQFWIVLYWFFSLFWTICSSGAVGYRVSSAFLGLHSVPLIHNFRHVFWCSYARSGSPLFFWRRSSHSVFLVHLAFLVHPLLCFSIRATVQRRILVRGYWFVECRTVLIHDFWWRLRISLLQPCSEFLNITVLSSAFSKKISGNSVRILLFGFKKFSDLECRKILVRSGGEKFRLTVLKFWLEISFFCHCFKLLVYGFLFEFLIPLLVQIGIRNFLVGNFSWFGCEILVWLKEILVSGLINSK